MDDIDQAQLGWAETEQLLTQKRVTLVTANQRQAQALLLRYAQNQRDTRQAWVKPEIVSWSNWLEQILSAVKLQYGASSENGLDKWLLTDYQSDWLWQQVIDEDTVSDVLLNRAACAQAARSAWRLTQDFRLQERQLSAYPSAETDAFIRWAKSYVDKLNRFKSIDQAQLCQFIGNQLQAGRWQPPHQIIHYGFERWLPTQTELLQKMSTKGAECSELSFPPETESLRVCAATDTAQELMHAALWAQKCIMDDLGDRSPIAVVVPDLHHRRSEVEAIFSKIMHPTWDALQSVDFNEYCLFDISVATQLDELPMIKLAMRWISLCQGGTGFSEFSQLLRSSLFDPDEQVARSKLEVQMRTMGLARFNVTVVMQLASQRNKPWHCPQLHQKLRTILDYSKQFLQRQTVAKWREQLSVLLANLDWSLEQSVPQDMPSDSRQALYLQESWQQLLDQFIGLDVFANRINGVQALSWLQRLASHFPVQRIRPHAQVHILGVLEALGQHYANLWITGLSANLWPAPPRPNAFLPLVLQRQHKMPQASAEQELEYAKVVTASLQAATQNIVFSYAQLDQDVAQRLSLLVKDLAEHESLPVIEQHDDWLSMWQQRQLENYTDQQALALPKLIDEKGLATTHGGSGVLKAQAQCPFQALAGYRLNAHALAPAQTGISALQHGNCVHAVLQLFWQNFSSKQIDDKTARENQLLKSIEKTLGQVNIPCLRIRFLKQAYQHYLLTMLNRWLVIEASRPSAFTVAALEQNKQLDIGPLRLNVRMDRVDRLGDDSYIVMDYKTGVGNANRWCDERVSEPQLPLYALYTHDLGGVVFANLKPGQSGFSGFTLQDNQLPGVYPLGKGRAGLNRRYSEWPELQDYWRNSLNQLAEDYYHGKAEVSPFGNACQFCGRHSLCRINSLSVDVENASDG